MRRFAFALLLLGYSAPAFAQEMSDFPKQTWSFSGPTGALDLASAQRGFQVYNEVCSSCHSMNLLHYRDLTAGSGGTGGIGLSVEQVKAIAASKTVPGGLDDSGEPITRPGLPSDVFKAPFANDKAAAAANGGAVPPDQSVLVNAREGGANYIYALLTGYEDPPTDFKLQDGLYYNKWFAGHQIHMPKPLNDDQVTYADGTKATVEQMARDVTTFLYWAANPEEVQRKQIGWRAVIFFAMMGGLTYALKRQVWSSVH